MENASKALIIAGAILLSILIISLGIMVYQNAKGTISESNLDSTEIETFNEAITQYCGTGKSAGDMNGLISAIAASNGAQKGKANQHYISITVDSTIGTTYYTGSASLTITSATTSITYPSFSAGITYKATYTMGADGYVNKVTIAKN